MRFTASVFLGLALLLGVSGVWGQDKNPDPQDAWSYFVLEEVLLRRADDPTLRSPMAIPQPKLILETTEDGKSMVTARVGFEAQKKYIASLELTGPQSSSGDTTALATLDGLSQGSSAQVNLSWILGDAWDIAGKTPKARLSDPNMANKNLANKTLSDYGTPSMLRPSAVAAMGSLPEYNAAVEACQANFPFILPILTVSAKVNREDFQFVNASTLISGNESHTGHQLTASLGGYFKGKLYLGGSYDRGTAFASGRTANLCTPFGSTGAIECRNLVVGRPANQTTEDFKLEIRQLFGSFGLSARITRDLRNDITFVEVPIYFLQKAGASGMELNGGVAVKWRSDTKKYSISAFIGPALSTVFRMVNGNRSSAGSS